MSKKRLDKKIIELMPVFSEVLVCQNKKLRPYMEIFIAEPENISHENLGTICGILEITDESEDSSYIVNYLISVLKKEYFSRPKRGSVESFESALRMANLALSKLAEHGSVSWIGQLNAILAVIEKHNVHIAQTGNTSAYLVRSKTLANITGSDGANPDAYNPLKTFVDVMSGRIEDQDKLILTTHAIHDIFSEEEIKKSAAKFSKEKFIQFLKTALGNELDRAAVLVVDVEKRESPATIYKPEPVQINAFSQQAWQNKQPARTVSDEEKKQLVTEIKAELEKKNDEFIDKKTGHIYIKDDRDMPEKRASFDLGAPKDKISEMIGSSKSKMENFLSKLASSTAREKNSRLRPTDQSDNNAKSLKSTRPEKNNAKKNAKKIADGAIKIIATAKVQSLNWTRKTGKGLKIITDQAVRAGKSTSLFLQQRTYWVREKVSQISSQRKVTPARQVEEDMPKIPSPFSKPDFGKLKQIFSRLDYQKKLYLLLIIGAIFIVPYFIARFMDSNGSKQELTIETEAPLPLPLENDKNVKRIDRLETAHDAGSLGIINMNDKIFSLTKDSIVDIDSKETFKLPDENLGAEILAGMDDLKLLFAIGKDNKSYSWSPSSKKFSEIHLNLDQETKVDDAKTYLTYIYILDKKQNEIWRIPRAESGGGFGEKTAWLRDDTDITQVTCMAINDSIYIASGGKIEKLSNYKKQPFTIESTGTPISASDLFTKQRYENLYVLDKENARIIKLGPDGSIISQYTNSEISDATGFTASEEINRIYFSTERGIKSFQM